MKTPGPLAYYSPERYLFPELRREFAATGRMHPAALYLIFDWKAPRARTRHRDRLVRLVGSFEAAARQIASDISRAAGPKQRLELLLTKWQFRLPTATAILTVLYPSTFTVYDVRVCERLGRFHQLNHRRWSTGLWRDYRSFVTEVRKAAPPGLRLRDCDRWLWGQNKRRSFAKELAGERRRNGQGPG